MRLRVFASHWGNFDRFGRSMPALLDGLKTRGFAGLEASLSDLGTDAAARRRAAEEARVRDLRLIVGLYSSWDDYEGGWESASPEAQLARLEAQFAAAAELPEGTVAHVNVHGGCDSWPEDVAGDWLARATGVAAEFLEARPEIGAATRRTDAMGGRPPHLSGVSFETHRGRILGNPFVAMRLLEYLEPLRLTADISHWHVVAERLLDDPATATALDDDVAPCVDHLHARIGSAQGPQLAVGARGADRLAPTVAHVRFWRSVWTHAAKRGAAEVLATPEYGPPPYQTYADGAPRDAATRREDLWRQIGEAKTHLEAAFAAWQRDEGSGS